ncbi:hypothetical protein [Kitasatospora sp. NPDC085879]
MSSLLPGSGRRRGTTGADGLAEQADAEREAQRGIADGEGGLGRGE